MSLVKRLKSEAGKDIIVMGGSEIGKSLFEAGLIDELGVNIHPVLLGSGIPLFAEMERQINLELTECRRVKERLCVSELPRLRKYSRLYFETLRGKTRPRADRLIRPANESPACAPSGSDASARS